MPKDVEFVQIEAGEDTVSVRDRLSFIRGKHVLLIWPEEGTALTRKLDLVLIQREAMRRAIRLALVTHDPQVTLHARELNISTFETIGASERGRWRRGRTKVFPARFQKPEDEPDPEDLMPVASRVRVDREKAVSGVVRLLVVGLLLAAVVALLVIVVPSATVRFELAQETVNVETAILADVNTTTTDIENRTIPARVLQIDVQETGSYPATGVEDQPDVPATGSVSFINQSEEAITIPAGTIVTTADTEPLRFQTLVEATLLAGRDERIDVIIESTEDTPGSAANVGAGRITSVDAEWADRVTVVNDLPTGGGESRSLTIISEADRENLLATVRQQLQARALEAMEPQLSPTEFIIEETTVIAEERSDWTTFSAQPGDAADSLTLTMRAIVEAVVVDGQLGERVVFAELSRQIPRGRVIEPGTLEYTRGPVVIDGEGSITFTMYGQSQIAGQVDVASLQQRLAGMSLDEAAAYLLMEVDLNPNTSPEILLSPNWFNRMPLLPIRITIDPDGTS